MHYPATFEATTAAGTVIVRFRDIPEALTEGATDEEARAAAIDALETALLGRMKDGAPIPEPSRKRKGERLVPVEVAPAMKLALYAAWRAAGLSKTELARRVGTSETEIRRMLDPEHRTKVEPMCVAMAALGKRATVTVEAA